MVRWLVVAAGFGLLASTGAQAQMKGLGGVAIAEVAKNRALDLRISPQADYSTSLHVAPSMLVHQDLTPNTAIGLGLANMYERRRTGDSRPGDRAVRSRKPAVTFVMKF
jgi:hypothetical protein